VTEINPEHGGTALIQNVGYHIPGFMGSVARSTHSIFHARSTSLHCYAMLAENLEMEYERINKILIFNTNK
jgi:hypothetical protein